jgi:putative ABC transport system permease protein
MMALVNDWRLGARMFVKQPGLTAAAVVALALGVGLTTLLFSIGYGIFLRGLPFREGRRIMAISMANVVTGRQRLGVTIHDFADWRAAQSSFAEMAAFQTASFNVVVRDGQPERLNGAFLTANGFELLRARSPALGAGSSEAVSSLERMRTRRRAWPWSTPASPISISGASTRWAAGFAWAAIGRRPG